MVQIMAELARNISSSLVLPFNCVTYADQLTMELTKFKLLYQNKLDSINISIDPLERAINNFSIVAQEFQSRLDNIDRSK